MHLVIFETGFWIDFAPLTLTRPVCSLASGTGTILQRQLRQFKPDRLSLWVRPELAEFCRQRIIPQLPIPASVNEPLDDQPAILLNAAVMRPSSLPPDQFQPCRQFATNGQLTFAVVQDSGLSPADPLENTLRWQSLAQLPPGNTQQQLASQIADLIHENDKLIGEDFAAIADSMAILPAGPFHVAGYQNVRVGKDVKIAVGSALDATAGPIILDTGVSIGANCVIEGPCYIGPGTYVRPISLVRGGMSIGPSCKVGGELAESIIQGNTNKVHDGYLGHSFLGEWVNLGAGTTTSNLKNTYGEITLKIGSREVLTGKMFLGSLIGDFTKAAIGSRFMSGTYIGVNSMIASSSHAPRFVPSFCFLTDTRQEAFALSKAIEVATRVFSRRNRPFTGLDTQIMDYARLTAESVER